MEGSSCLWNLVHYIANAVNSHQQCNENSTHIARLSVQTAHLGADNLVHSIADATNSHQGGIKGAMGDGCVTIQVTYHSRIIWDAGTQVLNGSHIAPVMHPQDVCHAASPGADVPLQL